MKVRILILIITSLSCLNCFSQKRLVEVEGTKFWINTIGIENRPKNRPVIVFENGAEETLESWNNVINDISKIAPVFAYDRAGLGKSQPVTESPTLKYNSDKLRNILLTVGIKPPYILVGHSLGGLYIRGYAKYYPNDLAGLIFVDPDDFTQTFEDFKTPFREIGLSDKYIDSMMNKKIANAFAIDTVKPSARDKESKMLWELRLSDYKGIKNSELPKIPVYFLVGGRFSVPINLRAKDYDQESLFRARTKHWIENWTNLVNQSPYGRLFYSSKAGHYVQYDDPELVFLSIKLAIDDYDNMIKAKK